MQENTANQKEQFNFPAYSDMPIKWPENWRHLMNSDMDTIDGGLHNGDENHRSDSGVGESVRFFFGIFHSLVKLICSNMFLFEGKIGNNLATLTS